GSLELPPVVLLLFVAARAVVRHRALVEHQEHDSGETRPKYDTEAEVKLRAHTAASASMIARRASSVARPCRAMLANRTRSRLSASGDRSTYSNSISLSAGSFTTCSPAASD